MRACVRACVCAFACACACACALCVCQAGTAHWMAPELMAEGRKGTWTDVYALGIILWEAPDPLRTTNTHTHTQPISSSKV